MLATSRRLRLCGYAMGDGIRIDVEYSNLVGHLTGVTLCASIWACPVCSAVIREGRAADINEGLRWHLGNGGGGLFVTLTLRHALRDELGPRLDVVTTALHRILKGRGWEKLRDELGYVGAIRSIETTDSDENGYHPHVHAALLFELPLSTEQELRLGHWLYTRWRGIAQRQGFGTVTREHGIDVRPLTNESVGWYLAKVQDSHWTAGRELARMDRKPRSVFARLDEVAETGDARAAARWIEYVDATRGRRAIQWSPGLRVRLLGHSEELSDEDLVRLDAEAITAWRYSEAATSWSERERAGVAAQQFSMVEAVCAALKHLGRAGGHGEPMSIEDPRLGMEREPA